jgi:hypothetical protein
MAGRVRVQAVRPVPAGVDAGSPLLRGVDELGGDDVVMTGRALAWTGGLVTAAAVAGLWWYWNRVGFRLNDALGWIGAVVGVAGLVAALYGLKTDRRNDGGQAVTDSQISGGITQIRGGKKLTIRRNAPSSKLGRTPTRPGHGGGQGSADAGDGQSVSGSQVGGHVDQVDGASGDVDIQEGP